MRNLRATITDDVLEFRMLLIQEDFLTGPVKVKAFCGWPKIKLFHFPFRNKPTHTITNFGNKLYYQKPS